MRPGPRKVIPLLIGTIVFVLCLRYILLNFQWDKILPVLSRVHLEWWLVVSLSIPLYWILRALRWFVLLRNVHVRVSLLELYFCTSAALSLSNITPLQSGEMLKVEMLKQRGRLDRNSGYGSLLIERVLDFVILVTLAVTSVLSSTNIGFEIDRTRMFYGLGVLVFLILAGSFVVIKIRITGKIGEFLSCVKTSVRNIKTLLLISLLTFLSWAVVAIAWWLCLHSISVDLSFRKATALMSIVTFINILSFIPGGFGVSEVSIVELLKSWQQDVVSAQASSLMLRFYGIVVLLIGAIQFLAWITWQNKHGRASGGHAGRATTKSQCFRDG
jgi:uncharacterized membrane protein YbhN (UPF0104 family)